VNTDYTALALIVDRSGSMHNIAQDVRGSVRQFIGDQKKQEGKASLTVTQFDHQYEVIYDFHDIKGVDEEKFAKEYSPRGSTALLDAIGRTTLALSQKIDSMQDVEKPKRVVVAIITDGEENASKEFTLDKIKGLIKQKEALGWDFLFMGATLDTIDVAQRMGFSADKSAAFETSNFRGCMSSINEQVKKVRLGKQVNLSPEERDNLKKPAEQA